MSAEDQTLPAEDQALRHNTRLDAMPSEARRAIGAAGVLRTARIGDGIYRRGEPVQHIVFPLDSVFSLLTTMEDGRSIEIATVGREGFLGLPSFLQGTFTSAHEAFCQVPGKALFLSPEGFERILGRSPALHQGLHRYTLALITQISQAAACNRLHTMRQRCVRWMLMTHDRVERDEFELTQEFLGQMLGARRAGVNEVQRELADEGLIRYRRGRLSLIDRPRLEAEACECYWTIREEHQRLAGAD